MTHTDSTPSSPPHKLAVATRSHGSTLDAIFRHPTAHNLEWRNVVALIDEIGHVNKKPNGEFVLEVSGVRHIVRAPHAKDLALYDVVRLRHFLSQAGIASDTRAATAPAPGLVIAIDHHGARLYRVDVSGDDLAKHVIKPYDPHHFLHHLVQKDQDRQRGQRAPEEPAYYDRIAHAAGAAGGSIIVVGHGTGKSNAAQHLVDYMQSHHRDVHERVVGNVSADLSSVTDAQLLALAREALQA